VPFELRLLNGMNPPVPEVRVLIYQRTAALANTDCTSRRFWDSSTGTSDGRSRNAERSIYDLINHHPSALDAGMQGGGPGDVGKGARQAKKVSHDLETSRADSRPTAYIRVAPGVERRIAPHRWQVAWSHFAADYGAVCSPRRPYTSQCGEQVRDWSQAAGMEDVILFPRQQE
jgi:hypothetical protein